MTITLPNLRVGNPVCHEALTVFPLFTDTNGGIEYRLSTEALADDSVVVEEINEGGSVREGEEYRASSPQGDQASALVFDGVLVHGSVLAV